MVTLLDLTQREKYGCTLRMVLCFSALINISFPFVLFGLVGGSCLEAFPTSKQDNAAVLPEVVPRWNSHHAGGRRESHTEAELWPDWTLTDKFMLLFTAVCQQEHTLWQNYETLSAARLCASTCSPLCTVCKCCECSPPPAVKTAAVEAETSCFHWA